MPRAAAATRSSGCNLVAVQDANVDAGRNSVCGVERCEIEAIYRMPIWQRPNNETVPLCSEHFAEYAEWGIEEFFRQTRLKGQ